MFPRSCKDMSGVVGQTDICYSLVNGGAATCVVDAFFDGFSHYKKDIVSTYASEMERETYFWRCAHRGSK